MSISASVVGADGIAVRVVVADQTAPSWTLQRLVSASTEVVRGGTLRTESGTVLDDTEAPFYELLRYRVVDDSDGSVIETSNAVTLTPEGYVWLTNPLTLEAARVQIETWPELEYPFVGGVFRAIGRRDPVIVSATRGAPLGEMEVWTETEAERTDLLGLLDRSVSFQLRASCPEVWKGYWSALDLVEKRATNDGSDPRRVWGIEVQQVGRPDTSLVPTLDTLYDLDQSLGTTPGTGTLQVLHDTYPGTLLDIAAADLTS